MLILKLPIWRVQMLDEVISILVSFSWTDLRIVSTFVLCPRHYTNWLKVAVFCVRVGSGGRVSATPVPIQVHANARSHETTLGSRQPRRKLHSHARNNDLVPDQHGGKILPNFSSVLIVNKWSVMFLRCTMTFCSDGLVNWLCECDLRIGF